MRKSSLLVVFLMLMSLVNAVQSAPETFTYGYQSSWETYENQIILNWEYNAPENFEIEEYELNRNDWSSPQIVENMGWGFYEDSDITIGDEYTYSLRVFLTSTIDASSDSTDYAYLTADTDEISDLLDPPSNLSLASTFDWENNKIPLIYWDYTPPEGYSVESFYIQRDDEEFPQMVHLYEAPWYYEDYNTEEGQTYSYTVKAMIANHDIMYNVMTEESATFEVVTSDLPLANITYSGWAPGEYNSLPPIELSTIEAGVDIYYTLDGSEPTTASSLYTGPVTIPWGDQVTLKARGFKLGETPSGILSLTYTLTGVVTSLNPLDEATNVNPDYLIFSWDSMESVSGYYLTIGSTSGSNDILDNLYFDENSDGYSQSSSIRYIPELSLERGIEYFWTLTTEQEGTGITVDNPEYSFTTSGSTTINTFPYQEGFEATSLGLLPDSWTDINLGYNYDWGVNNWNAHSGNNSMQMYLNGQDDWLFSAPIEMSQGKQYEINFQAKSNQYTTHSWYLVSNTGLPSEDNISIVAAFPDFYANTSYSNVSAIYESYEDQTLFLAFKPISTSYTYIFIDDLTISQSYLPIEAPSVSFIESEWQDNPFTLELTHSRENTQIFYYLASEDEEPYDFASNFNGDKILYSLPVELTSEGENKLYVQALNAEWDPSAIEEYDLLIKPILAAPLFSLPGGTYNEVLSVELISEIEDASIYYTLDESDPVTSPTRLLYTEGSPIEIALMQTVTIKAYSEKENYMNSQVVTATYSTLPKLDVVSFSPEAGSFTSAQNITLTNEEGTSIYYTLGEEEPTNTSTLYTEPIILAEHSVTTIKAIACKDGYEESDVAEATYTITGQVATPVTSLEPGIYTSPIEITLSTPTGDSEIRYTLDNTDPTEASMLYDGSPILVDNFSSLTIKAIAIRENWANSEVMEASYEVTGQLSEVVFSHDSGDYEGSLSLTLSVADYPTASIYYTTNNTAPTSESNLYEGQIVLNSPSEVTIQAIAVLENYLDSEAVINTYQVRNKVVAPIFNYLSGVYTEAIEVEISCATSSAVVYYATDGSDPATGQIYSSPITLEEDSEYSFRAIAIKSGWYDSDEALADYEITGTVPNPQIDLASGIYYEAITVTVTNEMAEAVMYYTLDGSTPTIASDLYEAPLVFNPGDEVTLSVIAFREDWADSDMIVREYTLPDETYIGSMMMASTSLTTDENPEFTYTILTNVTTGTINSVITILDEDEIEVTSDTNEDMIFSGITNSFTREVSSPSRGFAEGNYYYRLDLVNAEGDTLDTYAPTSTFIVGTPFYILDGDTDHDFGLVSAGSENSYSFTINSTGSLALELEVTEPDTPFSVGFVPTVLATGFSSEINISFNPESYGSYSDDMIISTNAGDITCSFSGEAVMGQYRDNVSSLSATVDYGVTTEKTFKIYNDSPVADLNIELVEAEAWISLDSESAVLTAGDSLIVTVTLGQAALSGGTYSANLTINTDDLNNSEVTIPITLTVNGASIAVSANPIVVITGVGVDVDYKFSITNQGPEPLNYNLTDGADWLLADDANGIIAINSAEPNELHFDGDIALGTYTTEITIQSNDSNTPELVIPVTFIVQDAIFGYLPADGQLDFGNVAIGSSKTMEITLKNTGNIPLTVNSLISVDPAFTLNPQVEDLELAGGEEEIIEVIFTPIATIFYNNIDLEVTYDDVNTVNFALFGRGEDPNPAFSIDWDDNLHDFGNVELASTETANLKVFNTGNVELHFADFDFEDAGITSLDDEDFTLDVGKDYTIEVSFTPDAIGEYALDITLNTVELATQTATVTAFVFNNSNTSTLTYPLADPYLASLGVNPATALAGTNFEFRVLYTDIDNQAPADGYPLFWLDLNHDGDVFDENELVIEMDEIDPADVTYTDGKSYNCFVEVPFGYNPYYRFSGYDAGFKASEGQATLWKAGPVVVDEGLDLGLYASHIEFDNYHPEIGEEVQVTAHIQNWGDMSAEDVPVTFLLDEVVFDIQVIDFIAGNSFVTLETSVIPLDEGFIPVKVHVNRNNANIALVEDNQLNNFASRPLVVGDVVVPGSIDVTATASPGVLYENSGQNFTVYGSANYVDVLDPNLDVSGSFVRITIRETGQVYTTHTNSWGNYSYTMRAPNTVGLYNIDVYVTDYTLEGQESTSLNIIPRPERYDLRIQVSTLHSQFPRVNPPTNDNFDIFVTVSNIGTLAIEEDITVNLNEGIVGMGGANLQNWLIAGGLAVGASESYEFEHPGVAVEGWYYFHGEALHADMASEDYTNNNYDNHNKFIYPALPDLSPINIYYTGLPAYRNHGVVGRPFTGNTTIKNLLVTPSDATTATVEYKGNATGNVWAPFSVIDVPALSAFEYAYLDFDADILIPVGQAGWYEFRVTVDPPLPGIIVEDDETNNVRTSSIEVKNPDWDFSIRYKSLEISNYNPNFGVGQVNFTADIENTGTDSAENVQVKFEYAPYNNGAVTGAWQQIGDLVVIPAIGSNDIVSDVTSDAWLVPDSDGYLLRVTVDPNDDFAEYNELNNDRDRWLGYDFYPWAHSDYYSTVVGQSASVGRMVSSRASWQADDVRVVFYDWFPNEPFAVGAVPVQIDADQIVNIPGNEGTTVARATQVWNQVGTHKITCHVDITQGENMAGKLNPNPGHADHFLGDYDNEIYESNNVDSFIMVVYEQLPDLVAWSEYINPEILNPDENESITIQSSFENHGSGDV
ncbi:chitobiase/beta-hexosaminidase C-terminal domain-containing protein, partial [Maridesulfovibrio ferrireducens]|uniref:chitobiase/beta-hexosaminidase C-terminal domain-containing protein n=1 Tax=Maridesulfovibrio ferrireducens TaxID=246191 RepID=UPI001A25E41C